MNDLAVNLLASAIAGLAVWLSQRLVRVRRLARLRAFVGAGVGADCTVAVSRHAASSHSMSVHRRDVAAVVEVATLLKQCGATADVIVSEADRRGIGDSTEFCIGGPSTNPRTAAHLARFVPALTIDSFQSDPDGLTFHLAGKQFRRIPGVEEFVLVFRIPVQVGARRPLWVICGQTARCNHAAARYLAAQAPAMARTYDSRAGLAFALKVVNPAAYDHRYVELVAEFTPEQLRAPRGPDLAAG